MKKVWKYFSYAVIIMYVVLGVFLLVSPGFRYIQKEFRVIFAIFLLLYAGWRVARIINAEREKREEEE
ncbi:MAG: hypothetical protein ACM3N9_03325 [Syntrophothermus sp.]